MDTTGTNRRRRVLTVIIAAVILVVIAPLAFWLGGNLVGLIFIFAWVGLIGYIFYRAEREPLADRDRLTGEARARESGAPGSDRAGEWRLLIAAADAASETEEIPAEAMRLIERADAVRVIVPTLPTRLDWLASATDEAQEQADDRLETVLGQLDQLGVHPEGSVGADDPLVAFEDAIRDFRPNHLLIALRGGGEADWQERGLLDQIDERFAIPKTVFELAD